VEHPARHWRHRHVGLAREEAPGGTQHRLGVRPAANQLGQRDRLLLRRALIAPHRLGVALDLRVDRVAQAEPLVAQLVDEFRLEYALRCVDVAYGFEKAEREEGVYCGEHRGQREATVGIDGSDRGHKGGGTSQPNGNRKRTQ